MFVHLLGLVFLLALLLVLHQLRRGSQGWPATFSLTLTKEATTGYINLDRKRLTCTDSSTLQEGSTERKENNISTATYPVIYIFWFHPHLKTNLCPSALQKSFNNK